MKSQKFVLKTLKSKLVGFNGHTIYYVYIEEQKWVIKVKDLRFFENTETKENIISPDYKDGKSTFQSFFLDDNNDDKTFAINENTFITPTSNASKKNAKLSNANTIKPKKANTIKLEKVGITKKSATKQNTKLNNANTIEPKKTYMVEPEKAKRAGTTKSRATKQNTKLSNANIV